MYIDIRKIILFVNILYDNLQNARLCHDRKG